RRPLDVVVERQQLIPVALQDRAGARRREVLPLETGARQLLRYRPYELIDEVEVCLTRHPLMAPAEVFGSAQAFSVVGSDVQHDRARLLRGDPADQRVERELADRDAQSARTLVADPQDTLAVRDDDDVHFGVGAIAEDRGDGVPPGERDEETAR